MSTSTRVAVVQLRHHPAFKNVLGDPLPDNERETSSLLPSGMHAAPDVVREKLNELRRRVRAVYAEHTQRRVIAILKACNLWKAKVVVFPEYAIPPETLETIAKAAPDAVVIAGSHYVDRYAVKTGVYAALSSDDGVSLLQQSVSPVLHGGRIQALVSKLQLAKPEVGVVKPGTTWKPVPLPTDIPGPMALLICLDYTSRSSEPHIEEVARALRQCRFIAAPALTPRHTLSQFLADANKDARRDKHPVLFANDARYGGTTIVVDEGHEQDLALFPEHAGQLEAGEEGIILADIDLGHEPVGPSTPHEYTKTIKPCAAASFIYASIDPERAKWSIRLESMISKPNANDLDKLEAIAEYLRQHPVPAAKEPSARKRRFDRLMQDIHEESSLERVRALATDIVLPEDVLPLDIIEAAMARGAADEIQRWIDQHGLGEFSPVVNRLRSAWEKQSGMHGAWSLEGFGTANAIRKAVAGGAPRETPRALAKLVNIYEQEVHEKFAKDAQEAGHDLEQGRYEQGRAKFRSILDRTQQMIEASTSEDADARPALIRWATKYRLMIALATLNLQEKDDAARDALMAIEPTELSLVDRVQLAEALATVGELARAKQIFPLEEALSETNDTARQRWHEGRQHLEILGGSIPERLADNSTLWLHAASLQLQRHDYAEAARCARGAIEKAEGHALTRAMAVFTLIDALQWTVFERPHNADPPAKPMAVGEVRADVIRTLEAEFVALRGAELPTSIHETLKRADLAFRATTKDRSEMVGMLSGGYELDDPTDERDQLRDRAYEYARNGRVDDALRTLPPEDHPWVGRLERLELMALGKRIDDALEEALALGREYPDRAPIEYVSAELLIAKGRRDEALAHAEKAFAALPGIGYRLLLAEIRFDTGDAEGAWPLVENLADDDRIFVLYARATLAFEVGDFAECAAAMRRYLVRRPDDWHMRLTFAQTLYRLHKVEDAAKEAWKTFQEHGDKLSPRALYVCGWFQAVAGGLDIQRTRRIKQIAERLKARFANDVHAEHWRLQLLIYLREIPEDVAPIDFDALVQAGRVYRGTGETELVDYFRQVHTVHAIVSQWARIGVFPVSQAARRGHVVPALLVARILERTHSGEGFRHLCPPVSLAETLPPMRLDGAKVLVSDLELTLLVALELVQPLQSSLGVDGKLVIFEDTRDRLLADAADLRIECNRWDAPAETRVACKLADRVHDLLTESWVRVVKVPVVNDLPPLRENANDLQEELFREPIVEMLSYRYALMEHPDWLLLTAEFFGSTGLAAPEIVTQLAWSDKAQYESIVARVREAAQRDVTFPALVRYLIPLPQEAMSRLCKLAELGFPDALGSREILHLERRYRGLDSAEPKRLLDAQEWIAREPEHRGGRLARLRLAQTYGSTIFHGFVDAGRTSAERIALLDALMGRVESVGLATATNVLDQAFFMMAGHTVDRCRDAWKPNEDKESYAIDEKSAIGILWSALSSWSGRDGSRRAAHGRAFREIWRLLSRHYPGGPPLAMVGALRLGVWGEGRRRRSEAPNVQNGHRSAHGTETEWSFLSPDLEALTILSARWTRNPFGDTLENALIERAVAGVEQRTIVGRGPREVRYGVNIEAEDGSTSYVVRLPVEAIFLRLPLELRKEVIDIVREVQGPFDGIAFDLLARMKSAPEDASLLDAYADHAACAWFRLVQDDPTVLLILGESGIGLDQADRDPFEQLLAILSEPNEPPDEETSWRQIFNDRVAVKGGIWNGRPDSAVLFRTASEVPGLLAAQTMVGRFHDDAYVGHIEAALDRIDHPDEHPIARIAGDVHFLRAAAAFRPLVTIAGADIDLRDMIPARFQQLLRRVIDEPKADTFAVHEAALLRCCAATIQRLAHPRLLSVKWGAWLTYRLFQWLCLQFEEMAPDARLDGMRRLATRAPKPATPVDRLDPAGFGRDHFDHRIATIVHAFGLMDNIATLTRKRIEEALGQSDKDDSPTLVLRSVSSPELEEMLVGLAEKVSLSPSLPSELGWLAPGTLPDLALFAALGWNGARLTELSVEARIRRFESFPDNPDALVKENAPNVEFAQRIVFAVANAADKLTAEERTLLERKLTGMADGPVAQLWRWILYASFYAAGADHLEAPAWQVMREHFEHPQALTVLGRLLVGVADRDPARLEAQIESLIRDATERAVDVGGLVAGGLARVIGTGKPASQKAARALLTRLAKRPEFRDDTRMRQVVGFFGIEEEKP